MVKCDLKKISIFFMALQFLVFGLNLPVHIFYNGKSIMNRMAVKWSNKSFFILPFFKPNLIITFVKPVAN